MHTLNQYVTTSQLPTYTNNLKVTLVYTRTNTKLISKLGFTCILATVTFKSLVTQNQIESLITVDYILLSLCMWLTVT